MKTVLFICVHNSGRSQMAEAFFNKLAGGKATAISAGTEPSVQVNPTVINVMKEIGIDLSPNKPKKLTLELLQSADKAITMGCGVEKSCPAALIPMEDWNLEDPNEKSIEEVRKIRDVIYNNVINLISRM
jgi:arsenate reductase (thioredoxin)